MTMTAYQKVKWMVIVRAHEWAKVDLPVITADTIDELYEQFDEGDMADYMQDSRYEIRASGEETGLPTPYSPAMRNYEYEEVAAKAPDGSWVGWTYWYGGGKHSEPNAIDWMSDAYDLDCMEQEKVIIDRTFTKKP